MTPAVRAEAVAAASLAMVTLVAVPGTRGLLGYRHPLTAVVGAAATMHLVMWACRQWRAQAAPLLVVPGFLLVVAWFAVPGTTVFGLPLSESWRAVIQGLGDGVAALDVKLGPDLVEDPLAMGGRLVLAVVSVAACAWMADQAAFRVRTPLLALVPSFSLLLLGATRAPADHPALSLAVYLVATLAFLLAHHAWATLDVTTAGRTAVRLSSMIPAGAGLAAVAVIASATIGPHLPGYGEPALVKGRLSAEGGEPPDEPDPAAVVASPLVDVNPTLIQQSDVELFAVRSPVPSYWRLTSLDLFDGKRWTEGGSTGAVSSAENVPVPSETVFQTVLIQRLRSRWLPAAYRPRSADSTTTEIERNRSSGLRPAGNIYYGFSYRVVSAIPRPGIELLEQARPVTPGPQFGRYLELPDGLSRRVATEARRITQPGAAGGGGPYAQALALQRHFRENFVYDLKVPPSHDEDALERFLFRTRRGYCEQFAAAFAVMARVAGIPSRVAVGFTPGQLTDDGVYQVQGLNAHAWPEVYLQDVGWLAFEPTPGRGMPGAESYTGVPAAQAEGPGTGGPGPSTSETTIGGVPTTATQATAPTTVEPATPGSTPQPPATATPSTLPGKEGSGSARSPASVVAALAAVALPALVVFAAGLVVASRIRRRRLRRRARARGPNDLVIVAWKEAADALAAAGLARKPSESILAHAHRAAADERLPVPLAEPMLVLAGRAGSASYSDADVDPAEAEEAERASATIRSGIRPATPLHRRVSRALDPRLPD